MSDIKIGIFGEARVGKSAMTILFVRGYSYVETEKKYRPTIEDSYKKIINVDNKLYKVEIIDTSGLKKQKEQYYNSNLYADDIDGAMFVFSLTSEESLKNIIDECHNFRIKNPEKCIIMCANKYDETSERCITSERCRTLAYIYNCVMYETSAKTGYNINKAFMTLFRLILEKKTKQKIKCILL